MEPAEGRTRVRITGRMWRSLLLDAAGIAMLAIGGLWLIQGKPTLLPRFPATRAEAWTCIVIGLGAIVLAALQLVRELQQMPMPPGRATAPENSGHHDVR